MHWWSKSVLLLETQSSCGIVLGCPSTPVRARTAGSVLRIEVRLNINFFIVCIGRTFAPVCTCCTLTSHAEVVITFNSNLHPVGITFSGGTSWSTSGVSETGWNDLAACCASSCARRGPDMRSRTTRFLPRKAACAAMNRPAFLASSKALRSFSFSNCLVASFLDFVVIIFVCCGDGLVPFILIVLAKRVRISIAVVFDFWIHSSPWSGKSTGYGRGVSFGIASGGGRREFAAFPLVRVDWVRVCFLSSSGLFASSPDADTFLDVFVIVPQPSQVGDRKVYKTLHASGIGNPLGIMTKESALGLIWLLLGIFSARSCKTCVSAMWTRPVSILHDYFQLGCLLQQTWQGLCVLYQALGFFFTLCNVSEGAAFKLLSADFSERLVREIPSSFDKWRRGLCCVSTIQVDDLLTPRVVFAGHSPSTRRRALPLHVQVPTIGACDMAVERQKFALFLRTIRVEHLGNKDIQKQAKKASEEACRTAILPMRGLDCGPVPSDFHGPCSPVPDLVGSERRNQDKIAGTLFDDVDIKRRSFPGRDLGKVVLDFDVMA
ncbi:hypothetical protein KCU83_g55, partial [Aureobasidium melanogenum]